MTVVGGLVTAWGARDLLVAKRCLDGDLRTQGWSGATITEQGCEIATKDGGTILVSLHGPAFEWFLAAALVTVLSLSAMVGVILAHLARRNRHPDG